MQQVFEFFCPCESFWSKLLPLPGVDLEPGFCVRLRALITSTSNWPFLSSIPICISPASGREAKVSASLKVWSVKKIELHNRLQIRVFLILIKTKIQNPPILPFSPYLQVRFQNISLNFSGTNPFKRVPDQVINSLATVIRRYLSDSCTLIRFLILYVIQYIILLNKKHNLSIFPFREITIIVLVNILAIS